MMHLKRALSLSPRRWQRSYYHDLSFAPPGGEPRTVLRYFQNTSILSPPPSNSATWVLVDFQYAPYNPADANHIQGVYPSHHLFPDQATIRQSAHHDGIVAGAEGIGRVLDIYTPQDYHQTALDQHLTVGGSVTFTGGVGTFRSQAWLPGECVIPLPEKVAANVNQPLLAGYLQWAGTALQLLRSAPQTPTGIILNAGNSAVGRMVHQLSGMLYPGVPVVSLVRQRQDDRQTLFDELQQEAPNVRFVPVSESMSEMRSIIKQIKRELPPISLALNAVGGDSSTLLLQCLANNGHHVTYGGLSRQPVTVRTPSLIFENLTLSGYWHSRWLWQQSLVQRRSFANDLVDVLVDDAMSLSVTPPPYQVASLQEWESALFPPEPSERKVIFDLSEAGNESPS